MIFNLKPCSTYRKQQNAPCLNCRMRDIGCHSVCLLYESFKEDLKELKLKYKKEYESPRSDAYRDWANNTYKNVYSET